MRHQRRVSDFHIFIDFMHEGTLQHVDIMDCTDRYDLQCGQDNPIRYLELSCNRKRLTEKCPDIMHDVVEGETKLTMHAFGTAYMVITKLWLTDHTYEFLASGIEVTMNTSLLPETKEYESTYECVNDLFIQWSTEQGVRFGTEIDPFDPTKGYGIKFEKGTPLSLIFQLCALAEDRFVFFADGWKEEVQGGASDYTDCIYYRSYSGKSSINPNPIDPALDGLVSIYADMSDSTIRRTLLDLLMAQRIVGLSSKQSEASSTVINSQYLSYKLNDAEASAEHTDKRSQSTYGPYSGQPLLCADKMGASNASLAESIVQNTVRRYKDPSRSITISLSESVIDGNGEHAWERTFDPFCFARCMQDRVNDLIVTDRHRCDNTEDASVLRLSSYIYHYPAMVTEYTFGSTKSSSLSQMLADLGKKV